MSRLPTIKLERPDLPRNAISDESFRVYCRKSADSVEIAIMDSIGDDGWGGGVSAEDVVSQLRDAPQAAVTVRINSPGGLAYDGLQIYNALAAHDGQVTTINEGLAYSAASIIFMAGDERVVHEASDFGIHRAHGLAMGNYNQMLAVAEFLENLDNHLISIYTAATDNSKEQITAWIDGKTNGEMGTMFGGAEAVEAGFADRMIENKGRHKYDDKLAAAATLNRTTILPAAIQARREMIDTLIGKR